MSDDTASAGRMISLNGTRLETDLSGALIWRERQVVVFADLHLEKGSSYHGRGRSFLPPYDSETTLTRLEAVLAAYSPEMVVCLGDSFHDREATARLSRTARDRLRVLTERHDWLWIAGNHDSSPPTGLGGRHCGELTIGGLIFRHEARDGDASGEVSGHYHPKASVRVRGRRMSARCYATDGRRLIMPAFGAYTGGLNVLAPAIQERLTSGFAAHLLGRHGVYRYTRTALIG